MSDERDETRQFAPFDDETWRDDIQDDETRPENIHVDGIQGDGIQGDGTRLDGTRVDTAQSRPGGLPSGSDETRPIAAVEGATEVTPPPARPYPTSVIPPIDEDWAVSRGRPWAGRAEVRTPLPGSSGYPEPDWTSRASQEPRDRWWLPIVVGIVVLVLLAGVGYGFYLLVRKSNDDRPATTTTSPVVPTETAPTTITTESTAPSTEPTTIEPTTIEPTTIEPTTTEPTAEPTPGAVTIPALKGQPLADAQAALQRVGVSYRLLYHVSDAQPGTVIDSDPPEGQEVPPNTTVTLVIAAAPTTGPANGSGEDH